MDPDTAAAASASLKQFNTQARRELKLLQKKLVKILKNTKKKESHKIELLLRKKETIEKLRISNQEHELLSLQVASLRKELRNEHHAKLVVACQEMVTEYVNEIKRETKEMIGACATSSEYHDPKELSDRTGASAMEMDETDAMFHEQELKMRVGHVMLGQGSSRQQQKNNNNYRHTLEAHVRGAELTGTF